MHKMTAGGGVLPRNKKERCCRALGFEIVYKPVSIPMSQLTTITIEADEFEALRLCDHDGKNQLEAAEAMGVSRGTVQRLLNSGRKKLIDALLNNQALLVATKEEEKL